MAIGGKDRTFAALKAAGRMTSSAGAGSPDSRSRSRPSVGGLVSRFLGNYPDRHWTWSGPACRVASELIRSRNIRLMYTSANPISFLRAALRLQDSHDLKWLFDARDPLGYGRKHTSSRMVPLLQERKILQRSIQKADHVTGLARSYGQIFFDLYGLDEPHFDFIPTGLDEAYLTEASAPLRENFLLHVGEVMPDQGAHALATLERILAAEEGGIPFDRIVFVGRREINEPRVRRLASDLPRVQERLDFLDHRPQSAVYDLIRRARACMLIPGDTRYWWTNFAKMVDYIALGAPVIAHVPLISEARTELAKAGTGFFLNGDVDSDSIQLRAWLESGISDSPTDYRQRYTARRQVADFAAILDRLAAMGS